MAAWTDRLARYFGYVRPVAARGQRRDFAAAQLSRLTGGWSASNVSANADLYRALDTLRARSRDLCNNNDYAKRFLGMVAANIVGGTGFTLQARVYDAPDKPDNLANDAIESAWARWCRRGVCDVTGRLSFRDVQLMAAKACARDGEVLVRKVLGKVAGNPFGFALQVLDIDRLDTRLIRAAENGQNEIRMGVEIDAYGRAVAYHLRGYHPGDSYGMAAGSVQSAATRIPAGEILHLYIADRPEQLRGLPWMHAAMTRLNNLGGYEEAAVIAARVGASKMGFFTTPDGEPPADGTDEAGIPYMEADPGSFGVLPPGTDFKPFDPDYPAAQYGEFIKACLRGIASGLGVAYHALANDLEGVNFSSIRSGTLEERDQWVSLQEWFKDGFIDPVYDEWLGHALAFGHIAAPGGKPLPMEKREKFAAHTFQGRRWSWVDPLKDMEAKILAIQNGLQSPQGVAAELGVDYEDILVEIKRAQEAAAQIGVTVAALAPPPAPEKPEPEDDPEDDPAVKSLKAELDTLRRDLAAARERPEPQPMVIHNHPPAVTIHQGETRIDNHLPAPAITNDVRVEAAAAPPPAEVHVTVEAVLPEQPAPEVTVNVEALMPDEMKTAIVAMPARETTTSVTRDSNGNITQSVQRETDA